MNVRLTSIVACLLLAATGCVTEPLEGDSIADRHTDNFDFFGFAFEPYELVQIQALNKDGQWETIRYAWSSGSYLNWNGMKLYYWEADATHIPHELSDGFWAHTSHPFFHHECEVRVIDSNGQTLVTFDQNYPDYQTAYGMTFGDLWDLAGNGSTLTLYSEN